MNVNLSLPLTILAIVLLLRGQQTDLQAAMQPAAERLRVGLAASLRVLCVRHWPQLQPRRLLGVVICSFLNNKQHESALAGRLPEIHSAKAPNSLAQLSTPPSPASGFSPIIPDIAVRGGI